MDERDRLIEELRDALARLVDCADAPFPIPEDMYPKAVEAIRKADAHLRKIGV